MLRNIIRNPSVRSSLLNTKISYTTNNINSNFNQNNDNNGLFDYMKNKVSEINNLFNYNFSKYVSGDWMKSSDIKNTTNSQTIIINDEFDELYELNKLNEMDEYYDEYDEHDEYDDNYFNDYYFDELHKSFKK